jgi:hypothetical protein
MEATMIHSIFLRVPVLSLFTAVALFARASDTTRSGAIAKVATNDDYKAFTINNLFNYYSNNGDGSYNKITSNGALEFPRGGFRTVVFEDGIVWGGYHKGYAEPKVGGSVYRHALQAGRILIPGGPAEADSAKADDPSKEIYRVFRVRPDVSPTTPFASVQKVLADEAALIARYEPSVTATALYDSYIKDWNDWPARTASDPAGLAPLRDINNNGVYEPSIDVPGQPGADQTLYYVANDQNLLRVQNLAGCPPIGLEVHRTFWGYNRAGPAGNIIFQSTLIINKSGAPVDSMFLVQWADPDVGDAGDDYVGCDRARNLGFGYNGRDNDATYGSAVPSAGYRLLQGPIVPALSSDSAVFRQQVRPGFKNLGMTRFTWFSEGGTSWDPAQGVMGNVEWYRMMNGLKSTGNTFINPLTNQPSVFPLDGDPVTGEGWVDGMGGNTPNDRRICVVTGPFTFANGETQEVVVANVVDVSADRLSGVSMMKYTSDIAKSIYDFHFEAANPQPVHATATGLDQSVVLEWGDPADYLKLEGSWGGGYFFQGYNLYQLPTASFESSAAVRIATFDLKDNLGIIFDTVFDEATGYMKYAAVQFGSNSGISRSVELKTSKLNGQSLVNGTPYYYAVTAYAVNPNPLAQPRQIETSPQVLAVVPQSPPPGFRALSVGDTLKEITHISSSGRLSDATLAAFVVDPTKLSGATYRLIFEGEYPAQSWSIIRMRGTTADTVAKGLTDQSGTVEGAPIIDGIQWKLTGAPADFKRFLVVANANGPLNPSEMGTFAMNSNQFPTLDGNSADGVNDRPSNRQQVGGGKWGICTGDNGSQNPSYSFFRTRTTQETAPGVGGDWPRIIPYDFEIRFTASGGKANLVYTTGNTVDVPFELWNIGNGTPDDHSDDYRMIPWINDVNGDEKFGLDKVDHAVSGGDNDPETDWIYWMDPKDRTPGHAGYDGWVSSNYVDDQATGQEVMARMVLVNWNGGSVSDMNFPANVNQKMPETGTVFRVLTAKPNRPADEFVVHTPSYAYNAALAANDISAINVFPNPYIGYNPLEANRYQRFVTFTHLPRRAVLRIFDLAGTLVRTLVKDDESQFLKWNLENEHHYLVGSAMYVVYIQLPDLGKTTILKMAVIQEQQWMDRW